MQLIKQKVLINRRVKKAGIPSFPLFTPLDLSHKKVLREIASNFSAYSDFNFVSLFSWNTRGEAAVATLNNNLVIKFTNYIDGTKFFSVLGTKKANETIEALLKYANKNGEKAELLLVPHTTAQSISSNKFEIEEDQDNHDYILSVNDLAAFRTNQFRGKKNLLNRFTRNYGDKARCHEIDLRDPSTKEAILKLLAVWSDSRHKTIYEIENEVLAIGRCIEHFDDLDIKAYGTFVGNELVGFIIFEILPKKLAILHFEKANTEYIGVFEHLKHNFAKHLATMEIEAINDEQDLGIEGLRKHKQSLDPVDYLKKYKVRFK